jgi:predicted deacylase
MPITMRRCWPAAVAASLALAAPSFGQAPDVSIGGVTAKPGSRATGSLTVAALGGDEGTEIPFTIVNGARPGPVLALVAGVHGMEYTPVLALQRLPERLDPQTLSGTLILVHVANVPSFLGRTIYYSPVDRKNLNRVFPGKENGTLSERIAHRITHAIIDRATHVVDLHCGDGNEDLRPYTYWVTTGTAAVAEEGRRMALAFGLDHIVIDRERPTDPAASVYLSNTAITRGKPALTIESGGLARTDEPSIARIEQGIAGLLRHLRMRPDGPTPVSTPVWIGRNEVVRSGTTGIFRAAVERGHTVAAGALLGEVTDYHGRIQERVVAPFAGEILYVVRTPPITKGEPLAYVGALVEGER